MKNKQWSISGWHVGKKIIIISAFIFLSAGCNFFNKTLPGGIIKTVNGGTDWQFSNLVKGSSTASMSALSISKLDFDPQNRQTVFAGAYNGGLYKSEDSGASWSNIFPNKIFVYDFVIHPNESKIIYAAGFYDGSGRVAKTIDGGGSWNEVYHEASDSNSVRSIALNSVNPNQVLIGTTSGTVIKSSDGGITWQLIKDFKAQVNKVLWQNNQIFVLLKTKGLQMSVDSGVNFIDVTSSLSSNGNVLGLNYDGNAVSTFSQVYVDSLDANLIYLTTDKGLYKTTDAGKNWKKMNLPVKTNETAARAISVSKTNSNSVYTSVNATVYKSQDGGATWQTQGIGGAGGFVNYLLIDPQFQQIVYGGIYATQ
jgi:photosystem II stability/assembly factor-like uncharacterized protein